MFGKGRTFTLASEHGHRLLNYEASSVSDLVVVNDVAVDVAATAVAAACYNGGLLECGHWLTALHAQQAGRTGGQRGRGGR